MLETVIRTVTEAVVLGSLVKRFSDESQSFWKLVAISIGASLLGTVATGCIGLALTAAGFDLASSLLLLLIASALGQFVIVTGLLMAFLNAEGDFAMFMSGAFCVAKVVIWFILRMALSSLMG